MALGVGRARLLVVEDDAVLCSVLARQLGARGHDVRVLPDGRDVLALARSWHPDLLILDVILPGPSGLEICARLRSRPELSLLPILMLTSLDCPEDVVAGLDAGANDYVRKPFDPAELHARVDGLLRIGSIVREMVEIEKHVSLGRLVSGLCHEINNPLTVLLGQIDHLRAEVAGPEQLRRLRLVEDGAMRIHKLVAGLREYSEPAAHPQQPIDINSVFTKAISIARLGWVRSPLALEMKLGGGLPPVMGDAERLQQVFINILTHAGRQMTAGGTIFAETGLTGSRTEWVFATVADSTLDSESAQANGLYDPFSSPREPWQSGGLTLTVARRIVDEHRGRIELENRAGAGSIVRVLLPPSASGAAAGGTVLPG
jgi:CheY-like chemotaxis protein